MMRFLHLWWQVAAVVLFTTILVLQIPRKALFFHPAIREPAEPFVSLLSLDEEAYARLVRQMRMSWQIRGRAAIGGVADSRTDAFRFSDPLPPPVYLPFRKTSEAKSLPVSAVPSPRLSPPSLARELPPLVPPPVLPDRDPALLALPAILKDCGTADMEFTLKRNKP